MPDINNKINLLWVKKLSTIVLEKWHLFCSLAKAKGKSTQKYLKEKKPLDMIRFQKHTIVFACIFMTEICKYGFSWNLKHTKNQTWAEWWHTRFSVNASKCLSCIYWKLRTCWNILILVLKNIRSELAKLLQIIKETEFKIKKKFHVILDLHNS